MEHTRLETDFLGFHLKSPVIVASSFLTRNVTLLRLGEKHGAGGASTKCAFMEVPFEFQPAIKVRPRGMGIISAGDKRIDYKEASRMIREIKQDTNMMILGNIMGTGMDTESWQRLAHELEKAGADAIEVNLSCPNKTWRYAKVPPEIFVAQHADLTKEVTEAVRAAVRIPIICKLSPITSSLREVAEACEEAGADAITAVNSPPSVPPIDIWDDGRISYLRLDKSNLGGLSGAAIFPIACHAVATVSQAVKIPVIGIGGITTWQDVVQMIMWGASTVQICTGIILYGFKLIDNINRRLENFMKEKGYSSINDFRGLALKNLSLPEQLEFKDVCLTIRQDLCNLCKRCLNIGQCLAISLRDNAIFLDNNKCIGCGTCIGVCPRQAIEVQPGVAAET